ncbi:Uma2 family endonuclease [Komarekiella sp. 'clone 1']|uniref:Uma2 family endonuclease n=1 Tax=Komarekiella delphini-convector SJRDD-AB1 TaxID=2593771 RepID=A0AA40T2I4_9NOST|nr:Uma2 family endonuclease [Komarekiella delphini-convector]MBD6619419.1 Uma2 family endonuclease [Komarekiella delphini-convector SJRDD-AB1]
MTIFEQTDPDLLYPDSDGKPIADNTEQYRWIVLIKENLEILFANNENVLIAGDLLWYPVRSQLITPTAPDVMVAFDRPKGKRRSYRQWQEDNTPLQVVFEILSPSNNAKEMDRKLEFYDTYGVEEYYLYDPESFQLDGWLRQNNHLSKLWQMDSWVSPRLGIRFEAGQGELVIYRPDGQRFLNSLELNQRAEQAELLLAQERQRADQLAAYLRGIGIDPDNLP